MAFEHPSNLPGTYDRARTRPEWDGLVFRERHFAQGAELNEVQTLFRRQAGRIGDLVARDGDRISGADIVVDTATSRIILSTGTIYVRGDARPVAARIFTGVALAGNVTVGVRLTAAYVTEDDDPSLTGLAAGSLSEGEPGAARLIETTTWALSGDGQPGDFFGVYLVRDGTVIDQTPPPGLSNVNAALAGYDRDANGNYVVEGCRVTALGAAAGAQVFSISEGVANIFGYKRTRTTSLRHTEVEDWDVETVDAEPHTFEDGGAGTATIALNHGPIDTINSVVITRQATETLVRGSPNNTSDALGHTGVTTILTVTQGATTYVAGTSYTLSADSVNWGPGGAEPTVGSSYQVTYRYLDAVAVDSQTADTITVTGGVTGTTVIVGYDWRLPRVDLICLDQPGGAVYLKGTSARRPVAPLSPVTVLPLAEVTNDWRGTPAVRNSGVRAMHYGQIWRMWNRLVDTLDLVALERLKSDVDAREPVAKRGVFVDPCVDDTYRDAGTPQDAAVFLGSIQLAIDPTFFAIPIAAPILLDYTEEVIIAQELKTGCEKINPYQSFEPLPARLSLSPSADFWTETRTDWLSEQTQAFTTNVSGARGTAGTTTRTTVADTLVDERSEILEYLRQIDVDFIVRGFGSGETLAALTFDGIDVTPAGLVANAGGEVTGAFTIPENVVAGTKPVEATGGSGALAHAQFVGQGTIDIDVMQRLTTVETIVTTAIDPQGETFAVPEPRHVLGVDIVPCAIGDVGNPVLVDLTDTEAGFPGTGVLAGTVLDMDGVVANAWLPVRWATPIFLTDDRQFAVVLRTDDANHAVAVADVGAFDAAAQAWVAAQPYTTGVRVSSSNARTWTAHQASDLTFRMVAARFNPTTKTVVLGTFNLVDCSDLLIRATVELPTADCSFHFEVVRASGDVIRLAPNEPHEFTGYVTETVTLRAVLKGTAKVSPTLFPGALLIAGKLRASGTYVSRTFTVGTGVRVSAYLKALLPGGAGLTVELDVGGVWTAVPLTSAEALNDGWSEREHTVDPVTSAETRLRLTLTGTPAARPALADPRAVSI
ncbi:DUF4815 domain-containing protein [Xanthobacter autotrophicus]|uniref:DUF4815 domain-containing protein n=1 Tax=Xanthobacter autotrophicus TaxID=280 RepID=UPI00372964E0